MHSVATGLSSFKYPAGGSGPSETPGGALPSASGSAWPLLHPLQPPMCSGVRLPRLSPPGMAVKVALGHVCGRALQAQQRGVHTCVRLCVLCMHVYACGVFGCVCLCV